MKRTLLLLLACACIAYAADYTKFQLTSTDPRAVCNDGSPATYFFRPGTGASSKTWVIYMEGGGYCYDVKDCEARNRSSPHYLSSKWLPATYADMGGILSSNSAQNPHFYEANQVYLWYCTSDLYAGSLAASKDSNGWAFQGKAVVTALIHALLNQKVSMKDASSILFTGCSAGAMGTFYNADHVGTILEAEAPNAKYHAYVDSGWVMDIPSYQVGWTLNTRTSMEQTHKNWNVTTNTACEQFYAKTNQRWRCLYADTLLPFLKSNTFFSSFQYDGPLMNGVGPPFRNASAEFAHVQKNIQYVQQLPIANLYNPNCYSHCSVNSGSHWNGISVQGVKLSDAVWDWFSGSVPNRRYVETCEPIGCSKYCPAV